MLKEEPMISQGNFIGLSRLNIEDPKPLNLNGSTLTTLNAHQLILLILIIKNSRMSRVFIDLIPFSVLNLNLFE